MQVCQWQLVQINPAARALALGGFRGTGAGAAGGAGGLPPGYINFSKYFNNNCTMF
jgi:hypothetical protein